MPDLETGYWSNSDDELEHLRQRLSDEYARDPNSDNTLRALNSYLNSLLEKNDIDVQELTNPLVSEALYAEIADTLNATDPALDTVITDYLRNIGRGTALASATDSVKQAHSAADPIIMFRGEFHHTVTDMKISGAGIDFTFSRTYKNQTKYIGPLGAHWDHNYNLWIRRSGQHLIRSNGALHEDTYTRHPRFGDSGFTFWVPPDGEHGIIEPRTTNDGDSFVWVSAYGMRYEYSPDQSFPGLHRVTRIVNPSRNYIRLSYINSNIDRIELNHSERMIHFHYDELNRLESITDFSDRRWSYRYDDYANLRAVTLPGTSQHPHGVNTRYEYSVLVEGQHHNLTSIVDPRECVYIDNEYGKQPGLFSYNRVIRQRLGSGESLLEYEHVIHEFDVSYEDIERPAVQVNLIKRSGALIHYVYNRFGNLLLEEQMVPSASGPQLAIWKYRYNADGALIAGRSPEGSIVQRYYGRDHFLGIHGVTDSEVPTHDRLTADVRRSFGNLLAILKRSDAMSPTPAVGGTAGFWGNDFGSILGPYTPEDVIIKKTYESRYNHASSVSDPRFTNSVDPSYTESTEYDNTLTTYQFSGPPNDPTRHLAAISNPSFTQPDGRIVSNNVTHISYDSRGRLTQRVDAEGTVTEFDYYPPGDIREGFLREERLDPSGLDLCTRYGVNRLGLRETIHTPKAVAVPGRFMTSLKYDELDRVVEVVRSPPYSHKERRFYDASGLQVRTEYDLKDDNGIPLHGGVFVRTYSYDAEKHINEETQGTLDVSGHLTTRHCYDRAGRLIMTTLPRGNRVRTTYDERDLVSSVTRGFGASDASTLKRVYDLDSNMVRSVSGRGAETGYEYDALGRLVRIRDPLGGVRVFTYDKGDNRLSDRFFQYRKGVLELLERTSYEYDELGRLIKEHHSLFDTPLPASDIANAYLAEPGPGSRITTELYYDRLNRVTKRRGPEGDVTQVAFDAAGRREVETNAVGDMIERRYDANNNVELEEHHLSYTIGGTSRTDKFATHFSYDELDRLETRTDALGNRTSFAYSSRDQIMKRTDPLGNTTLFAYDAFGRRTSRLRERVVTGLGTSFSASQVLPGIVQTVEYDENDNVVANIDGKRNRSELEYDALDRLIVSRYPDGAEKRVEYDPDDNLLSTTKPSGVELIRRYDPLNNHLETTVDSSNVDPRYSISGSNQINYEYDGLGRIVSAENAHVRVQRMIDSLGRILSESTEMKVGPSLGGVLTVGWQYDANGRPRLVRYSAGRVMRYERDLVGRILKIMSIADGAPSIGPAGLTSPYDVATVIPEGSLHRSIIYGNGSAEMISIDAAMRPIEARHTNGASSVVYQQLHDGAGNIRFRLTDESSTSESEDYRYDSLYRLTTVDRSALRTPFTPATFAPRPVGTVRQSSIDSVIGSLADSPANHTYSLDESSNRSNVVPPGSRADAYQANNLNQYSAVGGDMLSYDADGNLRRDSRYEYGYDGMDSLVSVNDHLGNRLVQMLHDPFGRRTAVIQGTATARIVWDGHRMLEGYSQDITGSTVAGLAAQYVGRDGPDDVIMMLTPGNVQWLHRDVAGNIRFATDNAGTIVGRQTLDPYGAEISTFGRPLEFGFGGRPRTPVLRTYDMRAREYSPELGRFLQRDPLSGTNDDNVYQFGVDNPLRFYDPMGTEPNAVVPASEIGLDLSAPEGGPKKPPPPPPPPPPPLTQRPIAIFGTKLELSIEATMSDYEGTPALRAKLFGVKGATAGSTNTLSETHRITVDSGLQVDVAKETTETATISAAFVLGGTLVSTAPVSSEGLGPATGGLQLELGPLRVGEMDVGPEPMRRDASTGLDLGSSATAVVADIGYILEGTHTSNDPLGTCGVAVTFGGKAAIPGILTGSRTRFVNWVGYVGRSLATTISLRTTAIPASEANLPAEFGTQ